MKILFCSPINQSRELGGSKVVVELSEEMQKIGWECEILSPPQGATPAKKDVLDSFPHYLREHLRQCSAEYEVVDYDHVYLPYSRREFSASPLFVARSVLLAQHLETIPLPVSTGVKAAGGRLLRGRGRQRKQQQMVRQAKATVEEADLINVSNHDDKAELMRQGIAEHKVVVLPYGISEVRRLLFDRVSSTPPHEPVVAFVGTFDYRKGAGDLPRIVQGIASKVPQAKFRLLGAGGMFSTEREIKNRFPECLRSKLEIVLKYKAEELPEKLSGCSVGIFPSYLEGMPFGVLEMLAASVPVIAYDAPGPPMLLPAELLVPCGRTQEMSEKVVALLQGADALSKARRWAKSRSQQFAWQQIAAETSAIYQEHLRRQRAKQRECQCR